MWLNKGYNDGDITNELVMSEGPFPPIRGGIIKILFMQRLNYLGATVETPLTF